MHQDDPYGRNLLGVAHKIDQGETPRFEIERSVADVADVVVQRGSVKELKFQGVEFIACLAESAQRDEFLDRWEQERGQAPPVLARLIDRTYALSETGFTDDDQQKLRDLFDFWGSFRILCVTRVLTTGSDRINEWSHKRALDRLDRRPGDDQFIAGEPVMMQVNDYGRMIFNGDQGLILNVAGQARARPQPMAVFRRSEGFAAFHLESLQSSLALSYAMTVHKAQGSEFDRVALFLPDRDLPINTREILYTALTRARRSAVIVGDREIFEAGIKKTIERDSGIAEKLLA
jgi:exodeoxyribonuclease V alpha subunit